MIAGHASSSRPHSGLIRLVTPIALYLGLSLLAGCHSSTEPSTSTTTSTTTTIAAATSLTIGGTPIFSVVGQNAQLTATYKAADGTIQDVTSQTTWQSSNDTAVSVSDTGLVTAMALGQATITATYQGTSSTILATLSLSLAGTWSGTGLDAAGSSWQITMTLSQTGSGLTGDVTLTGNGASGTGHFTAATAAYSTQVPFVVTGSYSACTLAVSGYLQASSSTMTGAYRGSNSCIGNVTNGQLTLVRQ